MIKWLKGFFSEKERPLTAPGQLSNAIPNTRVQLSEKTLQKLSERVNGFNDKIQRLQKMMEEFSHQQERMDDLAQKIIEVVAHVCTLDTNYKQLEKKVKEIQAVTGLPVSSSETKKNDKQTIFEL